MMTDDLHLRLHQRLFDERTPEAAAIQVATVLASATEWHLATLERMAALKGTSKQALAAQESMCTTLVRHCFELRVGVSGISGETCGRLLTRLEQWMSAAPSTVNRSPPTVDAELGVAHHGPPILTQREANICVAMSRWIDIARKRYGLDWLPSWVDIEKSRLFWRLRAGKEPLEHPPPTCYSCPWYEVVEELTPHWTMECWPASELFADDKQRVVIGQCFYEVLERGPGDGEYRVGFGPWQFRVYPGAHPMHSGVAGFYIVRIPEAQP